MPGTPLPVNRVVFIATPHLGSVDAVESMIRGETVLFGGQKELRKLARTFPGVYELLPNPRSPEYGRESRPRPPGHLRHPQLAVERHPGSERPGRF